MSTGRWVGAPKSSWFVRPALRLPNDWEALSTLCGAAGLKIAPSDKGQYERELLAKLGGLRAAAGELGRSRDLLMRFAFPPRGNSPGVHDEGVLMHGAYYVDLSSLAKTLGDSEKARAFADRYLALGLFERGLTIKCPSGRHADWYRMAELSNYATCHRCGRQYVYSSDASIFFKLDEMATLALKMGSYGSLLALDRLQRESRTSFFFVNACDVSRAGSADDSHWMEIDFMALADGAFIVGEAKSHGKLDSRARKQLSTKYVELCQLLRPHQLVVGTEGDAWDESSAQFLDSLSQQLEGFGVGLRTIVGADLRIPEFPKVETGNEPELGEDP